MRPPVVVGVQKLFLPVSESIAFARAFAQAVHGSPVAFEVTLCPSLLSLAQVVQALDGAPVTVAAQAFHQIDGGAHTGQVSLRDLVGIGVRTAMINHWEMRQEQAETDSSAACKIHDCLAHGVAPIVCIGETAADREAGRAHDVLERQIDGLFQRVDDAGDAVESIAIGYEPRWPLSAAGESALRSDTRAVNETCAAIREMLADRFGAALASRMRILYGGGVSESSARIVFEEFQGDGVLVGRASTRLPAFLQIINAAADQWVAGARIAAGTAVM
jgi:triosephosphate isomerase